SARVCASDLDMPSLLGDEEALATTCDHFLGLERGHVAASVIVADVEAENTFSSLHSSPTRLMRSHFAPRPLPVDSISPSDFIARNTSRTMSRLTPGQASSISEIENGRLRP